MCIGIVDYFLLTSLYRLTNDMVGDLCDFYFVYWKNKDMKHQHVKMLVIAKIISVHIFLNMSIFVLQKPQHFLSFMHMFH